MEYEKTSGFTSINAKSAKETPFDENGVKFSETNYECFYSNGSYVKAITKYQEFDENGNITTTENFEVPPKK